MREPNEWYVISGAPGSGKTTLVDHLGTRGYATVPETARLYIDTELSHGAPLERIRADERAFQHNALALQLELEEATPRAQITFFDRGVPDALAYYRFKGIPEDELLAHAMKTCSYKGIFLLPPLSVIPDYARTETKEEQLKIFEILKDVYASLPFPVIEVPAMPLDERAAFVLSHVN